MLFFTIPLYPLNQERFAFSLLYPNHVRPHKWYQWTVLPQKMMNSPTICQYYIAKALEPVRKQFPDFLVIHYMDDILFLAPSVLETQQMFDLYVERPLHPHLQTWDGRDSQHVYHYTENGEGRTHACHYRPASQDDCYIIRVWRPILFQSSVQEEYRCHSTAI